MNNYNEELEAYEEEAEDRYDDYNDYDEDYDEDYHPDDDDYDDDYDGYDEDEDDFEDDLMYEEDEYDSYQTRNVGRIDPNDRTITVVVKNTTDQDAGASLFGANQNRPLAAGITVGVEESSHQEVQEESKSNPFKIAGLKMSVSDELQFDNILQISRKTATGSRTGRVYQPRNATSPQNFTGKMIDDGSFEMDVTGQDSILFKINAGVTVVFTFTIRARANMGNILSGGNVAERSSAPRTTGLPQIDLLRRRRKRARVLAKRRAKNRQRLIARKRKNAARKRKSTLRKRPRR